MDVVRLIRAAMTVAGSGSVISFKQLDGLIGGREISAAEIEVLMLALSENGIDVIEDDAESEWPRRPG